MTDNKRTHNGGVAQETAVEGKAPEFVIRSGDPLCGGVPAERLTDSYVTPVERLFVRSHGNVPHLVAAEHRIRVTGLVRSPQAFTVPELRDRFAQREAVATLQCAGNRRQELDAIAPVTGEVMWGGEAVGNGRWGGATLADVLLSAGLAPEATHVWFRGADVDTHHGDPFPYEASISLERALSTDVLLAYELNGEPLAPLHGAPLRVVVPGAIGARSTKWLAAITVAAQPSPSYYQAHAYKLFGPEVTAQTVDWDAVDGIGDQQLGSFICNPPAGSRVVAGTLSVEGYATAGGNRLVMRVEVQVDGSGRWQPATLLDEPRRGAWVRWRTQLELEPGRHVVAARATDSDGHVQPVDMGTRWNFKGYMNDAIQQAEIEAV